MVTRGSSKWRSKWPGDGGRLRLSRRMLLAPAFAVFLRAQKPEISSFDLSLLEHWATPSELFFVREHFPRPHVSAAGWKLSLAGAVATPLEMSYEEIAAQPRKALPVTLECAENPPGGGLVSHAEWAGVSLASLLEKAQPRPEARFVRLSGADSFARSLPLAKAMHPDTLVAFQMNGERLPEQHGFPLRAVIPGWYGMDSVKWLRGMEVLADEDPAQGYVRQVRSLLAGTRPAGRVTAITVKSAFARPADGAILTQRRFVLRGAAWAGENRVQQVEVSTDGEKSWQPARLGSEPLPYCWVHWSREWKIPGRGNYSLSVRATDERGTQQPQDRPADRADGYELNAWHRIQVTVR